MSGRNHNIDAAAAAALRDHESATAPTLPAGEPTQQQDPQHPEPATRVEQTSAFHAALTRLMRGDTSDVELNNTNHIANTTTANNASSSLQGEHVLTENATASASAVALDPLARVLRIQSYLANRHGVAAGAVPSETPAAAASHNLHPTAPPPPNHPNPGQQPWQQRQRQAAAAALQPRIVRRVRVPRGAHITIGRMPAGPAAAAAAAVSLRQSQSAPQPVHLTVPVSELQPVVLPDQELREDPAAATGSSDETASTAIDNDWTGGNTAATASAEIQQHKTLENGQNATNDGGEPFAGAGDSHSEDERKPAAVNDKQDDGITNSRDDSGPSNSNHPQQDDLHHHRYKCSICYDYLDQPVGCGQCSGRFCATCLQQVLQPLQQQFGSNANGTGGGGRCPTCRAPFHAAVPDVALAELLTKISLPCPYLSCPSSEPISLSEYKRHESSCAGVRVACRYAPYGCQWKGYRSQLIEHEASDCALARLPVLLEQFRTLQVQYREQVSAMQHQTAFLLNTIGALESTLNNTLLYYRSNPLHLLAFVTVATTTTVRLVSQKTVWKNMYYTEEARASVFNAMALLPTVVLVLKLVTEGVRLHCRAWTRERGMLLLSTVAEILWLDGTSKESTADNNKNNEELEITGYLVEHLMTTLLVGVLGSLIVICFHKDDDSATAWTVELSNLISPAMPLPSPDWRSIKILQLYVFCASCFVYYYTLELRGTMVGFFVLMWTMVATLVLPCFLLRVTHRLAVDDSSAPRPGEDSLTYSRLDKCRAARPLLLGMHCGFCLSVCRLVSCVDMYLLVILVSSAVRGRENREKQALSTEKILVAAGFRGTVLAASAYSSYSETSDGKRWWLPVLEAVSSALICFLLSLITGAFFVCLHEVGTKLGDLAYGKARNAGGAGMVGQRPHYESVGAGVVVFSIWVFSLLLLIAT